MKKRVIRRVVRVKPCDCEAYPFCEHAVEPSKAAIPWRAHIAKRPDDSLNGRPYITDANGAYVCEFFLNNQPETKINLIVNAVNSFEAMREALTDARETLKRLPDVDGAYRVTVLQEIEKALKLAESQKQ